MDAGAIPGTRLRPSIDRAGNVIATLTPGAAGPFVALTAHLDTVLAPRNKEDIAVEPDGRLRGPGVADNGAGLAALLGVARALKSSPPLEHLKADLLFVANVGEEGEGNLSGMRYLCQQSPLAGKFAAFLVLDGANVDHITATALGSRRFEVTFSGPGGHSWSDYGVGNPVHALSRAVTHVYGGAPGERCQVLHQCGADRGRRQHQRHPGQRPSQDRHPLRKQRKTRRTRGTSECLHRPRTGSREPAGHRRQGGRTHPGDRFAAGGGAGGKLPPGSPSVRAVDAHLGMRSHLDSSSTDANIPLFLGIPAASVGAGGQGGGAHTPQEWYKPEGRDLGLKRVLLTLALLLRDPPPLPPEDGR